jgi:hypothetical protein
MIETEVLRIAQAFVVRTCGLELPVRRVGSPIDGDWSVAFDQTPWHIQRGAPVGTVVDGDIIVLVNDRTGHARLMSRP